MLIFKKRNEDNEYHDGFYVLKGQFKHYNMVDNIIWQNKD
jgi:hypothetical protein